MGNINKLSQALPYFIGGKAVLFIGAGLSKNAGCYDWDTIVKRMLCHPIVKSKNFIDASGFSNEETIDICYKIFKDENGERYYWDIIIDAFIKDPQKYIDEYKPIIEKIKLISPLPIIITTNIDNCMTESRCFDGSSIFYRFSDLIHSNMTAGAIFHVHGSIYDIENSLITKSQYLQRYRDPSFISFLENIFSNYNVVFLGYSLKDYEIKKIIQNANMHSVKQHFIVTPDDEYNSSEKIGIKTLLNIEVIEYGVVDQFGSELRSWIDANFSRMSIGGSV